MNLRQFSTLQIALGISVAVHAVLLTVRFVDPESFNRVFQDTPLEVILVNARTNEKPDKARAIAIMTSVFQSARNSAVVCSRRIMRLHPRKLCSVLHMRALRHR